MKVGSTIGRVRLAGLAGVAIALGAWLGSSGETRALASPTHAEAGLPATPGDTFRLLSQTQYANIIRATFGADIAIKVRFAPVNRVNGLVTAGASAASLTSGAFDPLENTARIVADQVVSPDRRAFIMPCAPVSATAADDTCASRFFERVGPLLYRRPLTSAELSGVIRVANRAAASSSDFYDGVSLALAGMLVSPQFLYIWERHEQDPAKPDRLRLDAYSKASRLSFLLWNAGPDEVLLKAAERGDLHKEAGLRKQVDRMFASPYYKDGVRAFFSDFLVLEAFDTLAKDLLIYPGITPKAVGEARDQVLMTVVDHLVDRRQDYRDLFTSRRTFMTADLGMLYGVPVDRGAVGWVPYEFSEGGGRAGLLTQVAFLSQHAHPGRSSATRRGRAIRETLLCQKVPDPPPNVDFSNFEGAKAGPVTARQRLDAHNENPVCAGCHRLTDPMGLALENFDGAGQFRPRENGALIDSSGSLDGVKFTDAVGLGRAMRDNDALKACIVNRLYAYSRGRPVLPNEEAALEGYSAILDKRGYRFDEMLRLMIADQTFFSVGSARLTAAGQQKTAWRTRDAHQERRH